MTSPLSARHFKVIVGLGNPGSSYERTRHNIGFRVVDALADRYRSTWKKSGSLLAADIDAEEGRIYLTKPQTFMNRSGEPLVQFLNYYKISLEALLVIHDEVDLPFGVLRLKTGGGEGGHNGLKSLTQQLGGPGYSRVRFGVGRPVTGSEGENAVAKWVLAPFPTNEESSLPRLIDDTLEAISLACSHGVTHAQRLVHAPKIGEGTSS